LELLSKKKVLDFDEFMKIPGCKVGRHIPNLVAKKKAPEIKPQVQDSSIKMQSSEKGVESYKASDPLGFEKPKKDEPKVEEPKIEYVEEQDPSNSKPEKGMACKRNGCTYVCDDELKAKENECLYHPGAPIFHEGSKGWSCCKKKSFGI